MEPRELENYIDGFFSGVHWAQKGQFYTAGGPYVPSDKTGCVHWKQYCRSAKLNNAAWRRGWADGQKGDIKTMCDWRKPIRTTDGHAAFVMATDYRPAPGAEPRILIKVINGPQIERTTGNRIPIDRQSNNGIDILIENGPDMDALWWSLSKDMQNVIAGLFKTEIKIAGDVLGEALKAHANVNRNDIDNFLLTKLKS